MNNERNDSERHHHGDLNMPPIEPTSRQLAVLRFIAEYLGRRGYAPSLREVMAAFGMRSTNGANDHLRALRRKGLLLAGPRATSRTITVTAEGWRTLGLSAPAPLNGVVMPAKTRQGPDWVEGVIYVIEAVGCRRVKIGFTKGDPADRCAQLQTGAPFPLRVVTSFPGTMRDESDLHARFAVHRIEQTEWFLYSPEVEFFLRSTSSAETSAAQ